MTRILHNNLTPSLAESEKVVCIKLIINPLPNPLQRPGTICSQGKPFIQDGLTFPNYFFKGVSI